MDTAKYLRDRAAEFANRAVTTGDAFEAQNLHELSIMCRESAERIDRHAKASLSTNKNAHASVGY